MEPLRQIAARQHGLFTRAQAGELGFDRKALRRRVRDGYLGFVTPRVLRIGGAASSPWETPMAGVLDVGPGALASHLTAAALWGVPNISWNRVDVSIERVVRLTDTAARIHHLTVIPPEHRAVVHDIPATSPPFTILLVMGLEGRFRGAQVMDHLLSSGDTSIDELWAMTDRLSKQGRNGLCPLRELLEQRSDGQPPPESNNERRFLMLAQIAGFTTLERQVDISSACWIGRVDFLDRHFRLIIEIQSERYHTSWANRVADAERIRRLEAEGYTVMTVWDREIWFEPELVIERLRQVRRRLLIPGLSRS